MKAEETSGGGVGSTAGLGAVNVERLLGYMLDQPWHERCRVVPDYMPPNPRPGTRPTVIVVYDDGTEYPPNLRHSCGPKQGFFWDIYGDDMMNVELALLALMRAPAPRSVAPLRFTIPLEPNAIASAAGEARPLQAVVGPLGCEK